MNQGLVLFQSLLCLCLWGALEHSGLGARASDGRADHDAAGVPLAADAGRRDERCDAVGGQGARLEELDPAQVPLPGAPGADDPAPAPAQVRAEHPANAGLRDNPIPGMKFLQYCNIIAHILSMRCCHQDSVQSKLQSLSHQ